MNCDTVDRHPRISPLESVGLHHERVGVHLGGHHVLDAVVVRQLTEPVCPPTEPLLGPLQLKLTVTQVLRHHTANDAVTSDRMHGMIQTEARLYFIL